MQRVLILAAASLAVLALGVPRYRGMQERLQRLEERERTQPTRERAVQEELVWLSERLAAVRGGLTEMRASSAQVEAGEAARRAEYEHALVELERHLVETTFRMAQLDVERESEGADTEWLVARDEKIPIGRTGTGWDTAHVALFLASDDSDYITGTSIVVDGGLISRF